MSITPINLRHLSDVNNFPKCQTLSTTHKIYLYEQCTESIQVSCHRRALCRSFICTQSAPLWRLWLLHPPADSIVSQNLRNMSNRGKLVQILQEANVNMCGCDDQYRLINPPSTEDYFCSHQSYHSYSPSLTISQPPLNLEFWTKLIIYEWASYILSPNDLQPYLHSYALFTRSSEAKFISFKKQFFNNDSDNWLINL